MTRDAEHTPTGYEDAASVVVNQAPAPSSLAGRISREQVLAIVRQFASPSWCSVDRLVDTLLAALSPEATALEGDLRAALDDALAFIADMGTDLHHARVADWYPEGANSAALQMSEDMRLAGNRCANYEALTPRHEAPADPCASHRSMGFHIDPCCPHCEAPAEGAGEAVVSDADILRDTVPADLLGREMGCLADVWGVRMDGSASVYPSVRGTQAGAQKLADVLNAQSSEGPRYEIIALRARSPAPEAREEALGNLLAVIHGDGGHRALEVGTKQAALEAEKIVAGLFAAPSADKLRGIVQRCVNALDASRNGGEFPDFEEWEADARQALAALKAEGA